MIVLDFADQPVASFASVSAITMAFDVVEVRHTTGDGHVEIRRLPGRAKGGDVTLTRRLSADPALAGLVSVPTPAVRDDVRIRILDEDGSELRRYRFMSCWPSKVEIGSLTADGSGQLFEAVTLSYAAVALG